MRDPFSNASVFILEIDGCPDSGRRQLKQRYLQKVFPDPLEQAAAAFMHGLKSSRAPWNSRSAPFVEPVKSLAFLAAKASA